MIELYLNCTHKTSTTNLWPLSALVAGPNGRPFGGSSFKYTKNLPKAGEESVQVEHETCCWWWCCAVGQQICIGLAVEDSAPFCREEVNERFLRRSQNGLHCKKMGLQRVFFWVLLAATFFSVSKSSSNVPTRDVIVTEHDNSTNFTQHCVSIVNNWTWLQRQWLLLRSCRRVTVCGKLCVCMHWLDFRDKWANYRKRFVLGGGKFYMNFCMWATQTSWDGIVQLHTLCSSVTSQGNVVCDNNIVVDNCTRNLTKLENFNTEAWILIKF